MKLIVSTAFFAVNLWAQGVVNPPAVATYPAAGIAKSTGSAWASSYGVTGTGSNVMLNLDPTFPLNNSGPVLTWDPQQADGIKFYHNLSVAANPGDPTNGNPATNWTYNINSGGGAANPAQTGWGWAEEGNYCPTYHNGTDLVVDGSNNLNVSSASYNFVAGDVNRQIQITAGTGWTHGYYTVSSVAANKAILASSPAPVGTTGGTWWLDDCRHEAHVFFVDRSGVQHRPFSLTVSKYDSLGAAGSWVYLLHFNTISFFNGDDGAGTSGNISAGTINMLGYKTAGTYTDGWTIGTNPSTAQVTFGSLGSHSNALIFSAWTSISMGNVSINPNNGNALSVTGNVLASAGLQGASGNFVTAGAPLVIFNNTSGGTNTSDIRFQSNGTNRWQINDNGGIGMHDYVGARSVFFAASNGPLELMPDGGKGVTVGSTVTDPGANNLAVTGTIKFLGTNSTAAVVGVIGSTCPAVTCTAAYTWVQAVAADGSTIWIPAWK
jgi:hypothetical protein